MSADKCVLLVLFELIYEKERPVIPQVVLIHGQDAPGWPLVDRGVVRVPRSVSVLGSGRCRRDRRRSGSKSRRATSVRHAEGPRRLHQRERETWREHEYAASAGDGDNSATASGGDGFLVGSVRLKKLFSDQDEILVLATEMGSWNQGCWNRPRDVSSQAPSSARFCASTSPRHGHHPVEAGCGCDCGFDGRLHTQKPLSSPTGASF
jgi:hypothetical protein